MNFLILMALLSTTVSVFAKTSDWMPLEFQLSQAIEAGDIKEVKRIVYNGVDINKEGYGGKPLAFAAYKGDETIARFLLSKGANPDLGMPLGKAASNGDIQMISLLLEAGADPNYTEGFSMPAIKKAIIYGQKKLAKKWSIDNGRSIHDFQGDVQIIKKLVYSGAKIEYIESRDWAPALTFAVEGGYTKIVSYLIQAGDSINPLTGLAKSPLATACVYALNYPERIDQYKEIFDILVDAGADIDWKSYRGVSINQLCKHNKHFLEKIEEKN